VLHCVQVCIIHDDWVSSAQLVALAWLGLAGSTGIHADARPSKLGLINKSNERKIMFSETVYTFSGMVTRNGLH
jgi:hypothetical protein